MCYVLCIESVIHFENNVRMQIAQSRKRPKLKRRLKGFLRLLPINSK